MVRIGWAQRSNGQSFDGQTAGLYAATFAVSLNHTKRRWESARPLPSITATKRIDDEVVFVVARLLLPEVQGLLLSGFRTVYVRMVDIDRRLRGKGFPNVVEPRSTEQELRTMECFLDEHIRAELAMWKRKSSFEIWYERNKVWVWAIGIVISVVDLLAKRL